MGKIERIAVPAGGRDALEKLVRDGNEGAATPPMLSLSTRGFNEHITGFPMGAEEGAPVPPQGKLIDAVANGDIDVAFLPFAGFFAKKYGDKLHLEPITSDSKRPDVTFAFPIAVGARKADVGFRDRLQEALDSHQMEIAAILRDAGVPLVSEPASAIENASQPSQ